VLERDRLLTFFDEVFVEHVHHFEE